jgi:hypothetical protein
MKQAAALAEGKAVEECLMALIRESVDLRIQASEALA